MVLRHGSQSRYGEADTGMAAVGLALFAPASARQASIPEVPPSSASTHSPSTASWVPRCHSMLLLAVLLLTGCGGSNQPPPVRLQAPPQAAVTQVPVVPLPAPPPTPIIPATDERIRAAIVLPLSGPNSALGAALLDAAQMAVFEVPDDNFLLLTRDTKGSQMGAVAAVRGAVEAGASVIIGPFYSAEVQAAGPVARAYPVPLLAFTSDQMAAGGGVWALGFAPAGQVRRVVGYAIANGVRRFAVLAPVGAYGDQVLLALSDSAGRERASIVRQQRYDPATSDMRAVVAALLGRPPTSTTADDAAAPFDPGFDALLIAEGGERLREIAHLLARAGVPPGSLRLLGTGLWDEATTAQEPALAGGWYAVPDPTRRQAFEDRYEAAFRRRPPRVASLAYDAAQLVAVLARGPRPAGFGPDILTNPAGFAGVDGIFRLLPDGGVERGLAVLEITGSGTRIVDPAPVDFIARTN